MLVHALRIWRQAAGVRPRPVEVGGRECRVELMQEPCGLAGYAVGRLWVHARELSVRQPHAVEVSVRRRRVSS